MLRNVIYGFNDGLTANFGLIAGVIGANVQPYNSSDRNLRNVCRCFINGVIRLSCSEKSE
ncbi:MAG: VIT1/CCC1 transporter family protein [Ignavibacteria bacterium]